MHSVKRGNNYILALIAFFVLFAMTFAPIASLLGINLDKMTIIHESILSQWIIIFTSVILYFIITHSSVKGTILFRKTSFINILLSIGLALTILPFVAMLNMLSQIIVENQIGNAIEELMAYPFPVVVFLVAITPAIVEELAMRGILLSNTRNLPLISACLLNGLYFGMFHMNINQFIYAFFLGVIFSFVVHMTGSIFPSMIMHFIVNGTNITLYKLVLILIPFFDNLMPGYKEEFESAQMAAPTLQDIFTSMLFLLPFVIIGGALAALCLWGLIKHNKKEGVLKTNPLSRELLGLPETSSSKKRTIFTPSLMTAIALFLLYCTLREFILPLLAS